MKKYLTLILILFLSSCATKKRIKTEKKIDFTLWNIAKELNSKGLKYIALKRNCVGGIRINKPDESDCPNCSPHYSTYILYNENDKSYIRKFDNCSEYNKIEITSLNPIDYLENHKSELRLQNVGNYKIDNKTYSSISHSCFREYWINDGQSVYWKKFDLYNLTNSNDHKNLNYESNNSLAIVILNKSIDELIKELERGNQFKRNKKTCYNNV